MTEEIDIAKHNISRIMHSTPKSSNEKAILKDLGLSAFSRAKALIILFEILKVKIMIKNRKKSIKEKWKK